MGILNKIRQFFSSAIECPDSEASSIVYMPTLKRNRVKLNSNLIVREGFVCLFVVKEKVTDVFTAGKHKLTVGSLPNTAKKIKLVKGKDKEAVTSFKADVYFVGLNDFNQDFEGVEAFVIKDEKYGRAKVRANGKFVYNVDDPSLFIKALLIEWPKFNNDIVKRQLNLWVSEEVIRRLKRLNLPLLEFAKNNEFIGERIMPSVREKFLNFGFEITNLGLTETFIPNRLAKALKQQNEGYEFKIDIEEEKEEIKEIDREVVEKVYNPLGEYNTPSFEPNTQPLNSQYETEVSQSTQVLVREENSVDNNFKLCNNCNVKLSLNANACYNCGERQEKEKTCPNCNASIEEGEFVCPSCRSIII